MHRKTIDMATWVWHPKVDSNIFFQNMKYIMDKYTFIKEKPKYILYSKHKQRHMIKNVHTSIFFGTENIKPIMPECDWAFSFALEEETNNDRYMRMPNYVRLGAGENLIKSNSYNAASILASKTKFCAFICSNGSVTFRNKFFKRLSRYKQVDAPGRVFNNVPMIGGVKTLTELDQHLRNDFYSKYDLKIDFLSKYKFVISFENEESLGYTSERIYHDFLANCISIYWGNPAVNEDFNPTSFVNYYDYGSIDAVIDRVVQLDTDPDLYIKCLSQPWYTDNKPTRYTDKNRILNRFVQIFGE